MNSAEIHTDYGQRIVLHKLEGGDVTLEAIPVLGIAASVTLRPSQADRLAEAIYAVNGTPRPA